MRVGAIAACLAVLSSSVGCGGHDALAPPPGCEAAGRVEPRALQVASSAFSLAGSGKIDLLLVVDNSENMERRQRSLAGDLDSLFYRLASGDLNDDGILDHAPPEDIHVAVVSGDMGAGGYPIDGCADEGGDGVFVTSGGGDDRCAASYPSFHSYLPSMSNPELVLQDVGCVIRGVGTSGCRIQQPLEAALKAITPSDGDAVEPFLSGAGHADGANAGFRRPDALLAILILTARDDCSARDVAVYDTMSASLPGDAIDLRCSTYRDPSYSVLQPIQRYVDGFLAAANGDTTRLFVSAIAGWDPDTIPNPDAPDYELLASYHRHQEIPDPENPTRLTPSCDLPGIGPAYPPTRLVELLGSIDAATGSRPGQGGASAHSCCVADYRPAFQVVAGRMLERNVSRCHPTPLETNADGIAPCRVIATLARGRCSDAPSSPRCATPADIPGCHTDPTEASCCVTAAPSTGGLLGQICILPQRGEDGHAAGWFYDASGGDCDGAPCMPTDPRYCAQRIAIDDAYRPATDTSLTIECPEPIAIENEFPCRSDAECSGLSCIDGLCGVSACMPTTIGASCFPTDVPPSGFDPSRVYASWGAPACGAYPCIVEGFGGRPTAPPVVEEQARGIYCSCQCAGAGDANCDCPDGFGCTGRIGGGDDAWCIRRGS